MVPPISCADCIWGEKWENKEEQLISTAASGCNDVINDFVNGMLYNFTVLAFKIDHSFSEARADRDIYDDSLLQKGRELNYVDFLYIALLKVPDNFDGDTFYQFNHPCHVVFVECG